LSLRVSSDIFCSFLDGFPRLSVYSDPRSLD
jgi:hypothetical protein